MSTRRELLRKVGLSTAGFVLATGFQARGPLTKTIKHEPLDAPWWLFEPLQKGSYLANHWSIASLSPIERGASVLTLVSRTGSQARVHICGHAGSPKGIASTRFLDLMLMDGGNGMTPSNESLGRVILSLAKHIEKTEAFLIKIGTDQRPAPDFFF